ncbi:MAG: stage III sporulation protein AB [Ruminococcus sp.]|nr:stage III sporulation protein AB [Ruminococcus sp.]
MLKLIGFLAIVISSTAAGQYAAARYKARLSSVKQVVRMIEQLKMSLEFESPTVAHMILELKTQLIAAPKFISSLGENADGQAAACALNDNPDGYNDEDLARLKELFLNLGSADKVCELARLSSANLYFANRVKQLEIETADKVKLSQSLGVLGGLFLGVVLI